MKINKLVSFFNYCHSLALIDRFKCILGAKWLLYAVTNYYKKFGRTKDLAVTISGHYTLVATNTCLTVLVKHKKKVLKKYHQTWIHTILMWLWKKILDLMRYIWLWNSLKEPLRWMTFLSNIVVFIFCHILFTSGLTAMLSKSLWKKNIMI